MQTHYDFLRTHKTVEKIEKIILKDCEQKYKKAAIVISKNLQLALSMESSPVGPEGRSRLVNRQNTSGSD
jgi:hypothetical protein